MIWFWTISLLWLIGVQTSANDEYCPFRFEPWEDSCLYLGTINGNAQNAKRHCDNFGGSLIVIENEKENNYLAELVQLGNRAVMILGCNNNNDEGNWRCIHKETADWFWFNETSNAGYWNWARDQPHNPLHATSCLFLHSDGNWLDELCALEQDMVVGCVHEPASTPIQCPISWERTDNKCTFIDPDYITNPKQAEKICSSQGGYVFVVDSEEQNQYLTQILQASESDYIMLGCSDRKHEGGWTCEGRSQYLVHWRNNSQAGYWNWNDEEPLNSDSENFDCMFLTSNGTWTTEQCGDETQTIVACEHAPTTVECPSDYEPWEDKCLYIQQYNGTVTSAREECQAMDGGSLVVIETEGQHLFLQFQVRNSSENKMPLGCSDEDEEGTWVCDGEDPNEFYWKSGSDYKGYWNWHPSQPTTDKNKNCLGMDSKGDFRSIPCEVVSDFLLACIYEALDGTTTSTVPGFTDTVTPTTVLNKQQGGLKPGAIAGILILCALVVLVIAAVFGYAHTHPSSKIARSMPGNSSINFESLKEDKS